MEKQKPDYKTEGVCKMALASFMFYCTLSLKLRQSSLELGIWVKIWENKLYNEKKNILMQTKPLARWIRLIRGC